MYTRRRLGLLIALCLVSACDINIDGNKRITVTGQVSSSSTTSTFKVSSGKIAATVDGASYTLVVPTPGDVIAIDVVASDISVAPSRVVVTPRFGVYHYHKDVVLADADLLTMSNLSGGSMQVASNGHPATVTVAPLSMNAAPGSDVTIRVAGYAPSSGLSTMHSTGGGGSNLLQSSGMYYVDAVDASGTAVDFTSGMGVNLAITPYTTPDVDGAGGNQGFELDADGSWVPKYSTSTSAMGANLLAQEAGYWNADRRIRTVCVKGTLKAPTKQCSGEQVSSIGQDNIGSNDTSGAGGTFCIEGGEGHPSTISVGSTTQSITMPLGAGNCGDPSSCKDLGDVMVSDDDCPASCTTAQNESATGCEAKPTPSTGGGGGTGSFTDCSPSEPCCPDANPDCGRTYEACASTSGEEGYFTSDGKQFICTVVGDETCIENEANATVAYCEND